MRAATRLAEIEKRWHEDEVATRTDISWLIEQAKAIEGSPAPRAGTEGEVATDQIAAGASPAGDEIDYRFFDKFGNPVDEEACGSGGKLCSENEHLVTNEEAEEWSEWLDGGGRTPMSLPDGLCRFHITRAALKEALEKCASDLVWWTSREDRLQGEAERQPRPNLDAALALLSRLHGEKP